jgi:hypothetical protein
MKNEEHDLKIMLGIPLLKSNSKPRVLGGLENPAFSKELSRQKLDVISSEHRVTNSQI